ncbi:MAG TPA: adenosylcobinamide-GDP ribazoletransferase [Steroidobacteraceae bacterium]|nr:adenosylcobinamide-GDP ribazoletransferase [Steroidobacteraceae bacterium]
MSAEDEQKPDPPPSRRGRAAGGLGLTTLLAAIEFLTPLQLRRGHELDPAAIGRCSAFFPTVGLLLGLVLEGLDRGLSHVLPPAAEDAILVAALVLLSGGLHLDGLADSADGLFGGRTRERRLEIMRDSRIGSFGALALGLVLLLQWSALLGLASPWRTPALLLFPALGRCVMPVVICALPYARPEGLGVLFRRYIWPWPVPVAVASSLVLAVLLFGAGGVILVGAAVLFALLLGMAMAARLGGLTGDTYGALCELTQILVLLLILSGQRTGWVHPWLVSG